MNIQMTSSARSVNVNGPNVVKGCLKKVHEWMETSEEWSKIVLSACVLALAIDTLFLFIPEIDYTKFCIGFDGTLRDIVCVFRFLIDAFYVIHIISSQTPLRGVRKSRLYLILDILSILPIPQVMVLDLSTEWSNSLVSKKILKWNIVCQYIPRIIRIYPIYKKVTKTTGRVAESKWIGALLNLLLFLFFGYVFGAFWYVTAIEKKSKCWDNATGQGNLTKLYCAHLDDGEKNSFLKRSCRLIEPDKITTEFDFGMYIDVLKSEVASKSSKDFPKKVVYCVWWGFRNLSTYAQGLIPGNSATDSMFAIIICASGLFLFALLIGNVQKYLQSITSRVEEMEERKRDTEIWMTYRKLPKKLQERIKEYEKNRWEKFRGTDEEALLRSFPEELRDEIKGHFD